MADTERTPGAWRPETERERGQVREQLGKILASAHFQNSRRYPGLLRYVVEQTLEGKEADLKERLLGIEVFHRAADYDTNQDPVVRLSAAEVRKRIALYYQQADHQGELVIGLNPGSYVPYFLPPANGNTETETPVAAEQPAGTERRMWRRLAPGFSLAAALVAGAGAGWLGWRHVAPVHAADRFWAPIVDRQERVTLCVGTHEPGNPADAGLPSPASLYGAAAGQNGRGGSAASPNLEDEIAHSAQLGASNVVALIHVGADLESRQRAFRMVLASQATFPELHEGPVVLVAALDNVWTVRLTQALRYGFGLSGAEMFIVDHKNPSARQWQVSLTEPTASHAVDYAVLARYDDATLGQPVVILAGLASEGTEAASEVLSNSDLLESIFRNAPGHWAGRNFEAVLQTEVLYGHPGPSRIVAVEYW